jgi:hypothetical protein
MQTVYIGPSSDADVLVFLSTISLVLDGTITSFLFIITHTRTTAMMLELFINVRGCGDMYASSTEMLLLVLCHSCCKLRGYHACRSYKPLLLLRRVILKVWAIAQSEV